MENLKLGVRNAVRALIIENGRILLLRKDGDPQGERYALPGGAQELGETLVDALQRECLEEIGSPVEVEDLLFLADWFKARLTEPPSTRQLVEFMFACRLPSGYRPHNGHRPDKHQREVVWVELKRLPELRLLPLSLARHLANPPAEGGAVYLGTLE